VARRLPAEPVGTSMGRSSSDVQGCRSHLRPRVRPRRGRDPRRPRPLRAAAGNHVLHGHHPEMKALGFSVRLCSTGVFAWWL
jgi:hypothetical protein